MDFKKTSKGISRFFGWLGFTICSLIIRIMPAGQIYGLARGIASLGYAIAVKQRKIALDSLGIAFKDEKSPGEREHIARDSFVHMAKSGVELLFLMDRPALLRSRVAIEGKQNLDKALARGNGAILVSAHFGNFPLMMAKLSLEGYAIAGIMRHMRDQRMERIFLEKRNKLNINTIYSQPRDACVMQTIQALRENRLVFIPIDQNFGTAGIFVDFFGTRAATATGPVVLAQRTKAAILPCFIVRQPDDTQRVIFEPVLELQEGNFPQETISLNIQRLTNIIESYIRRYPAEWGWIHRRWKSRPN